MRSKSPRDLANAGLDEWNIPNELYRYDRTDAAIAQILLERVQGRLPQWVGPTGAARLADRRGHRKVELWPQRLLTINWADSAPGYSWPAEYRTTYIPGFDRTVVTVSVDCAEVFGVCDVGIGWFGPDQSILEGSRQIIVGDSSGQRSEWDQRRWVYVLDTGLVSAAEAEAWADEVWGDLRDEKGEEGCSHLHCREEQLS